MVYGQIFSILAANGTTDNELTLMARVGFISGGDIFAT
jgi:hypothetical protein